MYIYQHLVKKLKIKEKKLNYQKLRDYDLSKIYMGDSTNVLSIKVYPLIKQYYDLSKDEVYKLYFIYSFNHEILTKPSPCIWDNEKPNNECIFNGCLLSNNIKLMVK